MGSNPSEARIFSEFSKHLIYHVFVVSSLINLAVVNLKPGGRGVLPYMGYIGMCGPNTVFGRFGHK